MDKIITQGISHTKDAGTTGRMPLDITWADVKMPLLYMLCMALLGLHFYPALLFIAIMWVWAWKHSRDQLFAMTFLFFGTFGMTSPTLLPIKAFDLALITGFLGLLIVRKPRMLKISLLWYALFVIAIFWIASYSIESMKVQIRNLRYYVGFISVTIPFLLYANTKFDIRKLYQVFMVYFLIMCAFYIIDAVIFKGNILVPATFLWGGAESTIFDPYLNPFSLKPIRKFPLGMYILGILVIPIARMYRFNKWQILLMIGGLLSTQTATLLAATLVCITIFQGSIKRIFQVGIFVVVVMLFVISLDFMLSYNKQTHESTFRIASTYEQFGAVLEATNDEDLAEFMSGRIGQILPVVDLVQSRHTEWTGLGFIHPEQTHITALEYFNEYESDIEKAEKTGVDVEISQVQVWAWIGWIGLIVTNLFYGGLMLFVRKMRYRSIYYSSLLFSFILGIGGMCGIDRFFGVYVVSTAYALVLLDHYSSEKALSRG